MKKKILYTFLILMLIVNAVLLYLIIDKQSRKVPPRGQTFLTEELNFSEDQKDQFLALDRVHRDKMMEMDEELDQLRKLMFNSFDSNNLSIDTLTMKMGDIEADKQNELFSFFTKVRKLCDEDQQKKFDEIIQEVLHRRGPKPPKGDHKGPPPPRH